MKKERMEGGYTVWTPEWHWARASRNRTELNRWSLKRYGNSSNRCVLSVSTAILGVRFSFFVSISKVSDRHKEWPRPEMAGGQKGSLDARTWKRERESEPFLLLVISSPFLKRKTTWSIESVFNHHGPQPLYPWGWWWWHFSSPLEEEKNRSECVCVSIKLKKIKLQRETNFLNWYRNWETCTRETNVVRDKIWKSSGWHKTVNLLPPLVEDSFNLRSSNKKEKKKVPKKRRNSNATYPLRCDV